MWHIAVLNVGWLATPRPTHLSPHRSPGPYTYPPHDTPLAHTPISPPLPWPIHLCLPSRWQIVIMNTSVDHLQENKLLEHSKQAGKHSLKQIPGASLHALNLTCLIMLMFHFSLPFSILSNVKHLVYLFHSWFFFLISHNVFCWYELQMGSQFLCLP